MKKILLLSTRQYSYLPSFQLEAKKIGNEVICALYSDVIVSFFSGVKITVKDHELDSFHSIYFQTVGVYRELKIILTLYAQKKSISVFDKVHMSDFPWMDTKSVQYAVLALSGIPIIPSHFLHPTQLRENIVNELGYPCIVKIPDEDQGEGVFLGRTYPEVVSLFEKYARFLLVQKFIPNEGDIRAFVVGDKVVAAMKRASHDHSEFRNNVSKGSHTQSLHLSAELKELAIGAAHAMHYDVAGVDLIFDSSEGVYRVMEVNISPQFQNIMSVTNVNIPKKIVELLISGS